MEAGNIFLFQHCRFKDLNLTNNYSTLLYGAFHSGQKEGWNEQQVATKFLFQIGELRGEIERDAIQRM